MNFSIVFGVICLLFVLLSTTYIQFINNSPSVDLSMGIVATVFIVAPLLLFLILHYILTKRYKVLLTEEEIRINENLKLPLNRIIKVKHIVNRNAFHSLTIIHLDTGEKYSIAPINKFHGYSLAQFQKLAYSIEIMYNQKTK